jgi:hypothetical protein
MAYQEYVQKAIATGKSYDELPAKVKGAVSLPEWKKRCEGDCTRRSMQIPLLLVFSTSNSAAQALQLWLPRCEQGAARLETPNPPRAEACTQHPFSCLGEYGLPYQQQAAAGNSSSAPLIPLHSC